jgi:transposase
LPPSHPQWKSDWHLPTTPPQPRVHPLAELLEETVATGPEIHLIMDNHCTHKSAAVQRWLKPKKRRRFHFHFTPTSSSWLNQVERFFALITDRMIRRGAFYSTQELEAAIYRWLANWNGDPTPFVWKRLPTLFWRRSAAVKNYLKQQTRSKSRARRCRARR